MCYTINLSIVARVGWEELNYTISETNVFGQACVVVFNPPNDVPLEGNIQLEYQSVTGTAGMIIIVSFK